MNNKCIAMEAMGNGESTKKRQTTFADHDDPTVIKRSNTVHRRIVYKAAAGIYGHDGTPVIDLIRLSHLERMITTGLGRPLGGVECIPTGAHILDLSSGPGDWVLDLAFDYPGLTITGIDQRESMVTYATTRLRTQHRHNASFATMDLSHPLAFPDHTFDVVTGRLLTDLLPRDAWPQMLKECLRVLKPGGTICFTETNRSGITNSNHYTQLSQTLFQALYKAGYGWASNGETLGISPTLEQLLRQAGAQNIKRQAAAINIASHSKHWSTFYHQVEIAYFHAQSLIIQTEILPLPIWMTLYQQTLLDLNQPEFWGLFDLLSIRATKPLEDRNEGYETDHNSSR
jgi:ubiquinone/menaquinone biosynthesis C-methylase UbiE